MVLSGKLTSLQNERTMKQEQIKRLSTLCHEEQLNNQKSHKLLAKICTDEVIKEQQWSNALNKQLQKIVSDYDGKIDELEAIIEDNKL